MARQTYIQDDLKKAISGNEDAILKLVEHYNYLRKRIIVELRVPKQLQSDVDSSMVLGILETLASYDGKTNFPSYVERNMRYEANNCLTELISVTSEMEIVDDEYCDMNDILENICNETLAKQMLMSIHVSNRKVVMARYGFLTGEQEGFKSVQQICGEREGSNTTKNLSRITNAALADLRELFTDQSDI